jgi:hypothetical protein
MKNFKKMMALIIAAVMVIGTMGTTAFADPDAPAASAATYDQTITIDGLDKGDSVDFYQILKWVGSKTDGLTVANVDGWDVCEPFHKVIKTGFYYFQKAFLATNTSSHGLGCSHFTNYRITTNTAYVHVIHRLLIIGTRS